MKLKRVAAFLSALCMMLTAANGGIIDAFITASADNSTKATEKATDATQEANAEEPTVDSETSSPTEDSLDSSGLSLKDFSTAINAGASETFTYDSFTYSVSNEQVTITNCDTSASGEIEIPETIDNYPVVTIASYTFENCERITAITLPSSITTIGSYAFKNCASLSSITLGGVQKMNSGIFEGCTALTSLTIPNTLTESDSALRDSSITSVVFEEGIANIPANICSGASALTSVTLPEKADTVDGYSIGEYAFYETSLSKIELPESLTSINSSAFQGCTLLTSVTIPDNVKTIGSYAFYGCSRLADITLGQSVSSIGSYAFQNDVQLTDITFNSELKTINSYAFAGCTRLTEIELPKSITTLGSYAFSGDVSLSSITLGGVQKMNSGIFEGCTALTSLTIPNTLTESDSALRDSSITSVVFEEGIANIPANICSGASALVNVLIPEKDDTVDGYTIGEYAFYDCPFLNEINIPDSITGIGRYAFANCSNLGVVRLPSSIVSLDTTVFQNSIIENVQISKEDSPVALVLIDNEIQYTADETGIKDAATKYLDRSITDYHATASSVSAAGMVTLAIDYDFKSNAKNLVSDMSMKIKLPSAVTVTSGSVRIDGTAVDYSESNGYLIIPVENQSGSVRFTVEPNDAAYLLSYAQMTYKFNGTSMTETIGIVNMATKLLTLNVPNETSSKLVHVTGVTSPRGEVSIYVDDELVESCTASAVGNYSTDVLLKDVAQDAIYKIEAKAANADGTEVSALDYVKYNAESIKLTTFNMYFRNNEYDLVKLNGTSPVISWAGNNTYTFIIDFNNNLKLDVVRVVSTKGNEVRTINAIYDPTNDYYVATGFYNYVPGTISVEYKELPNLSNMTGTEVEVEDNYTIGDSDNVNGYLTQLNLTDDNGSILYYYEEFEENADFVLSDNFTFYSDNGTNYYVSIDEEWFYRDNGIFLGKECFTQNNDGTYDAYRYGVGMFDDTVIVETPMVVNYAQGSVSYAPTYLATASSASVKKKVTEKAKKVVKNKVDEEIEKAFKEFGLDGYYNKSKIIIDILNTNVYDSSTENDVYNALNDMINNVGINESQLSSKEQLQLTKARTYLDLYKMTNQASSANSVLNKYVDQSFSISGDVIVPGSNKLNSKFKKDVKKRMKDCVNAMDDAEKKISNQYLSEVMSIMTDHGWFSDSLLEKLANQSMENYDKASVNFSSRYAIDPSGYVYEGVASNRVSGVKATIYYKETEDSEAVVWDATEYDQINPLYSDEDGAYAWDVPEGLWQVEFVKDGYEISYSDWLPVPPEQLEVNVEMISTSAPGIEFINAYNNEIQIVFDQYVDITTVNEDTVIFTVNGETVTGIFDVVDAQTSASDSSMTLAKVFNFITYDSISGKLDYSVSGVTNYAGTDMASEYKGSIDIVKEITGLKADSSVTILYKDSGSVTIQATPGDAAAGKTLLLSTDNTFLISIPESVTFDASGIATIPVSSLLPGEAKITFTVEGTTITGSVSVLSTIDGTDFIEDNTTPDDVEDPSTGDTEDPSTGDTEESPTDDTEEPPTDDTEDPPTGNAENPSADDVENPTTDSDDYFASIEEMCDMAVWDYVQKNSIVPANVEAITNDNGSVSIQFSDEEGNILDIYMIDPTTGIGMSASGKSVNLPQTGNNSLGTVATVATALALTLMGAFGVLKSGVIRRRKKD